MGTWIVTKPTAITPPPFKIGSHRETPNESRSTLRRLAAGEIKSILPLAMGPTARVGYYSGSRPVFLVTFTDNSTLVLKAEVNHRREEGEHSARWEGKMMHQASSNFNMKMLSSDELQTLQNMPEVIYSVRPMGTRVKRVVPAIARAYVVDLIGAHYMFYKMPYYESLFTSEIALKGPQQAVKLYTTLSKAGVLRSLGHVIAGDLFNGNNDRFSSEDGRLVNSGNVFFHKLENGSHEVIGVDFYDAQGEHSNMRKPLLPNWSGYRLQSKTSIESFALLVANSLNQLFAQVEGATEFGQSHAWQIALGMQEAVESMKAYLNRRMMGKPIAPGVLARARALGWGL